MAISKSYQTEEERIDTKANTKSTLRETILRR